MELWTELVVPTLSRKIKQDLVMKYKPVKCTEKFDVIVLNTFSLLRIYWNSGDQLFSFNISEFQNKRKLKHFGMLRYMLCLRDISIWTSNEEQFKFILPQVTTTSYMNSFLPSTISCHYTLEIFHHFHHLEMLWKNSTACNTINFLISANVRVTLCTVNSETMQVI
jgi:hypothetical protein